jgi:hypothetical protein
MEKKDLLLISILIGSISGAISIYKFIQEKKKGGIKII